MASEFMTWILSGVLAIIGVLVGTLWSIVRGENASQDAAIKVKANQTSLDDSEKRWEKEFERLRHDNERVIEKIENRHDKEMAMMESRLCTKIESMEGNVLRQIELIMELLKKRDS